MRVAVHAKRRCAAVARAAGVAGAIGIGVVALWGGAAQAVTTGYPGGTGGSSSTGTAATGGYSVPQTSETVSGATTATTGIPVLGIGLGSGVLIAGGAASLVIAERRRRFATRR